MGSHPLNLALRFLLEIAALLALGRWGYALDAGAARYVLMLLFPLAAGTTWGTFAIPNDPSRSGRAPVPVSGVVRLAIELLFFSIATLGLVHTGFSRAGAVLGVAVLLHYVLSYDRIVWMLGQR